MAASKFSTYDQIGQVEDVDDVISNITPFDYPFQTMVGKGTCKAKTIEWQEDTLRDPVDNAFAEGSDAPAANHSPTEMLTNYTQIMMRTVKVTGGAEAVALYGRDSEFAYQLAKEGKGIRGDLEHALVGRVGTKDLGSDAAARRFDSPFTLIHSDTTLGNSGTPRPLTEALVTGAMQKLYDTGGEATVLMIRPVDAPVVADWAFRMPSGTVGGRTREMTGGGKRIVNAVDVIVTPFGDELRVVKNRWLKKFLLDEEDEVVSVGEAMVFNPKSFKIRWLRKWRTTELPSQGDWMAKYLLGEMTVQHRNRRISARITDLN